MSAYSAAHGGDVVRTSGGVVGTVFRTTIRAVPDASPEYNGTTYTLRTDAGEVEARDYEVSEIVAHGPHDYWQPRTERGERRGHCRRCGVKKSEHARRS